MPHSYYNEFDPFAAEWLRNLITEGLIPDGVVDDRSIADVQPADLKGFTQQHFFAGVGGWPYALRLAGWPDDRPVITGSCPCQPFSAAGKRQGEKDERHLWPEFFRLIREFRPPVIFGEQVASAEVVGTQLEAAFVVAIQTGDFARANKIAKRLAKSRSFHYWARWIDGVQADLASIHYAFGFKVLGAHSVTAPHIRQRVFWVADRRSKCWESSWQQSSRSVRGTSFKSGSDATDWVAHADLRPGIQPDRHNPERGQEGRVADWGTGAGLDQLEHPPLNGRQQGRAEPDRRGVAGGCGNSWMDYSAEPGRQGCDAELLPPGQAEGRQLGGSSPWYDSLLIPCRDGKARRVSSQSRDVPLASGIPRDLGRVQPALAGLVKGARRNRVGRLKGYGNAIVPQVAAEFIRAYQDTMR